MEINPNLFKRVFKSGSKSGHSSCPGTVPGQPGQLKWPIFSHFFGPLSGHEISKSEPIAYGDKSKPVQKGVQKVGQKVVILGVRKWPHFRSDLYGFLEQNPFCLRARARARAREGPQKWPFLGQKWPLSFGGYAGERLMFLLKKWSRKLVKNGSYLTTRLS